jgi:hypothetical protein
LPHERLRPQIIFVWLSSTQLGRPLTLELMQEADAAINDFVVALALKGQH